MKVAIQSGRRPVVIISIGNPERHFEHPCNSQEQAQAYANGVIDGARYLHSEVELPNGWSEQKENGIKPNGPSGKA